MRTWQKAVILFSTNCFTIFSRNLTKHEKTTGWFHLWPWMWERNVMLSFHSFHIARSKRRRWIWKQRLTCNSCCASAITQNINKGHLIRRSRPLSILEQRVSLSAFRDAVKCVGRQISHTLLYQTLPDQNVNLYKVHASVLTPKRELNARVSSKNGTFCLLCMPFNSSGASDAILFLDLRWNLFCR